MLLKIYILLIIFFLPSLIEGKLIEYNLNLAPKNICIAGKKTVALAINDSVPGPTLKAHIGDILRITVHNSLAIESSLHWHGVLLPNIMDGVPYITSPAIMPAETFVYEFPIKHSGTYWYHAHSALQEQQGIYGSLVFYPAEDTRDYDEEYVVVLSDWTHEKPEDVLVHIKKDPDYYALKKDAVQSWLKILKNGSKAINLRLKNSWDRMTPMDISDIGYDAFLINGKQKLNLSQAKTGTRVKLRIINAGASSYFILEYSGGPMKVVEADGVKVDPFTAQRIRIAMAETYDVIVTIPERKTYEFRASAEDGTGYAVVHIGEGELIEAPTIPKPNLVLMDMMQGMDHGSMAGMDGMATPGMADMPGMDHSEHQDMQMDMPSMHISKPLKHVGYLTNYKNLKSPGVTMLPAQNPMRSNDLRLTGSMLRYVWTINNAPMYRADKIYIKKGENVRFSLINQTMMNHPIHIHGHFFRVLNGQGDYSPLKHTVNVAPFETVNIEFEADQEKDWIFHCHNLYHMKLGMGGVLHYEGTEPYHDTEGQHSNHSSEHGNTWFSSSKIEGFSNLALTNMKFMRNDDTCIFAGRYNYDHEYELEFTYRKYVSEFWAPYVGVEYEKEDHKFSNKVVLGVEYTLPLLVKADLRLNTLGKARFTLSNEHQLSDRLSCEWEINTDKEYIFELHYAISKQLYLSGNWDNREYFGIGFSLRF